MNKPSHCVWISTLSCTICGDPQGSDPCHVKSLPDGRLDGHTLGKRKTAEGVDLVVPMCRHHHREQHTMSEAGFWTFYGIDAYGLACELYRNSGDTVKAMGLLGKAARERMMSA